VLCRFTAFVAVDRSAVVNPGGQVHGIIQPVEEPEGWEMRGQTLYACAAPMARSFGTPAYSAPDILADAEEDDAALYSLRLGREAGDAAPPASGRSPGLMESLLGMFKGKKKAEKTPASQPTPDLDALPRRVANVLQCLQTTGADAVSRLNGLRAVVMEMDQLFSAMLGASKGTPEMLELAEVIVKIRALLSETQPDDAAVNALWWRTETALKNIQTFLAGSAPASRKGFWK
jgi:hypothetical protein